MGNPFKYHVVALYLQPFFVMYITTTMCDGVLHCLLFLMFFWCPYMAINNVNVQYNGGFLPDIILLTPMLSASGNLFKCHEEV